MMNTYFRDKEHRCRYVALQRKKECHGNLVVNLRHSATRRKVAVSISDFLENVGALTSHNPMGLHGLLQG
jgi:hypothetical protein